MKMFNPTYPMLDPRGNASRYFNFDEKGYVMRSLNTIKKEMKMFDPKITEGEWLYIPSHKNNNLPYLRLGEKNYGFYLSGDRRDADALAIAALPELLEIYKATKSLLTSIFEAHQGFNQFPYMYDENGESTGFWTNLETVENSIDNLESKHCKKNDPIKKESKKTKDYPNLLSPDEEEFKQMMRSVKFSQD